MLQDSRSNDMLCTMAISFTLQPFEITYEVWGRFQRSISIILGITNVLRVPPVPCNGLE